MLGLGVDLAIDERKANGDVGVGFEVDVSLLAESLESRHVRQVAAEVAVADAAGCGPAVVAAMGAWEVVAWTGAGVGRGVGGDRGEGEDASADLGREGEEGWWEVRGRTRRGRSAHSSSW